jgi:hypothetical protein
MRDVITMELDPAFFRSLGIALLAMDRNSPAAKKFLEYVKLALTRDDLLR